MSNKVTFSLNESRKIAYSIKTQQKLHNSEKTPATNSPPSIMKYALEKKNITPSGPTNKIIQLYLYIYIFSIAFFNLIFETSCSYICS
jgi:hypothetical protein